MRKLIITGGSGFIGTNLLDYYLNQGVEVLNIDIKSPRNTNHLKYWSQVDIVDKKDLSESFQKFQPNYVIHLAARTDLNEKKKLNGYAANIEGVENIILAANKCASIERIVFTSSMLVCKVGYIPKDFNDYCPTTLYGQSKVMGEQLVKEASLNVPWCIIRPTSIWGSWFGAPYRNFFDKVISKRYFHIGRKSCTKTYGYVENLIYQIDSILNAPVEKIQGNVFYLGDYEPININNWANEIASEIGISIKTIPYPFIKLAAIGGDLLKLSGINYPMTSFRLKNMTTNNVLNLLNTIEVAPKLPFSRIEGIRKTLSWLKTQKKISSI